VKQHVWLRDIDWQAAIEQKLEAKFFPVPRPPLNLKAEDQTPEQVEESNMLLRRNSIQNLFNGYDFDADQLRHQLL
jgi:hypothetical protein